MVDEIGNAREVAAVKDIAQRGVAVVATAHGTNLQRLLENPVLNTLVGGKQKMVIGDFAARCVSVWACLQLPTGAFSEVLIHLAPLCRSCDGRKTKQERCEAPTFSMLAEVVDHCSCILHTDVAASVDTILQGRRPISELRFRRSSL